MTKIGIILKREYLQKVRNKTFIILTLIGPLLYGLIFALPIFFATFSDEKTEIEVVDESNLYTGKLKSSEKINFIYSEKSFNDLKKSLEEKDGKIENILHIPKGVDAFHTQSITVYSKQTLGIATSEKINSEIENATRELKLKELSINRSLIDSLDTRISIQSKIVTEKGTENASTGTALGIGIGAGFFMYFFIFLYGGLILRSVQEEKQNRVIEVLISSVKPFDLMMGKIIALALVGLTQFLIWGILTFVVTGSIISLTGGSGAEMQSMQIGGQMAMQEGASHEMSGKFANMISTINFPLIIGAFIFYFLGGYLLYSALFAAAAAAADSQQDTQQFMLPVSIPIIIAMVSITAVVNAPQGPVAIFLSLFPLTSPISMMARIGFEVPVWQLLTSVGLLIATFLGAVYFAAKIYRVGILMYGKKTSWKEIIKWIRYS